MAEALGVVGSALGVISFGLQACQGLVNYYQSWKDSRKDVTQMISGLEGLASTLELLNGVLSKGEFPESQVENVRARIEDCVDCMVEFSVELSKVEETRVGSGERMKLRQRIREGKKRLLYPFRESTILKLNESVGFVTAKLELAMQILQLSTVPLIQDKLDNISKGVNELVNEHGDEKRRSILRLLTSIHCNSKQEEILSKRELGTGTWLFEDARFKDWLSGRSQTLLGLGGPGVGKTVLASAVINHIQARFKDQNVGIGFIYCNYSEKNTQTIVELLGSLIQQLVTKNKPLPKTLLELHQKHTFAQTRPSYTELSEVLQTISADFESIYVVVDALDECDSKNGTQGNLLEELRRLGSKAHTLYTSRYVGVELDTYFSQAPRIDILASNEDVRKYLRTEIQSENNLTRLSEEHQGLSETIVEGILSKAAGMFLLAHFHIKSLATKLRVRPLLKALEKLDENLNTTYDNAIERIKKGQDQERTTLAMNVLIWVTFAIRPLNVYEMQHAMAAMELEEEDQGIDKDDLYPKDLLVTICAGLVFIDEHNIVRLTHFSTQQYLETKMIDECPRAQAKILKACVNYLSMSSFLEFEPGDTAEDFQRHESDFNILLKEYPLLKYSCQHWTTHLGDEEDTLVNEIIDLVHNPSSRNFLLVTSHELFSPPETFDERYAQSRRKETLMGLANCFSLNPLGSLPPLFKAAIFDLESITELLLRSGVDANLRWEKDVTALHLAAFIGSEKVLERLLQNRPKVNAKCKTNWGGGWTPLHLACAQGDSKVVSLLLDYGAKIEAEDSEGRTPLIIATRWSWGPFFLNTADDYHSTVRELVKKGANVHKTDWKEQNALFWPCCPSIRDLLLRKGVNPSLRMSVVCAYPVVMGSIFHSFWSENDGVLIHEELINWLAMICEMAHYPSVPRTRRGYENTVTFSGEVQYTNQQTLLLYIPPDLIIEGLQVLESESSTVPDDLFPEKGIIIVLRGDGTAFLIIEEC